MITLQLPRARAMTCPRAPFRLNTQSTPNLRQMPTLWRKSDVEQAAQPWQENGLLDLDGDADPRAWRLRRDQFRRQSASIGSVGETEVSTDQFARSMQGEVRALSERLGQPITMAQAREFGVDRLVQARLFASAAVDEQARIMGVSVGDEEVRRQILATPAFQDPTGKFDRETYKLGGLRQQGMTEAAFEAQLRAESGRAILQAAVIGGVPAPKAIVDRYISYIGEARAVTTAEITQADLTAPIAEPQEADLQAWYEAHPSDFTSPETRKITYAWVTPDMLEANVELDETALREAYDARADEFLQPERRLVEQLVYPPRCRDCRCGQSGRGCGRENLRGPCRRAWPVAGGCRFGRDDAGRTGGAAGEAVFALEEPGVVGPIDTDLGPALYSMNAILEAKDVSFDEAQEELAGEARMDRARRIITDNSLAYEDDLAGGVTLEDLVKPPIWNWARSIIPPRPVTISPPMRRSAMWRVRSPRPISPS